MFFSIYDNRSGEEYTRRLAPNELLDVRQHVRTWVEREFSGELRPLFSAPGSHIPNGCGDYQAEIRRTKREAGSCLDSAPFFLEGAE